MSLYVRVFTNFYTHRKTARLRLRIGSDALWVPPRLWSYAAENQPDGSFQGYSAEEIAMLIGYAGDAKAMLEALLETGFMDADLSIHNWEAHNGYHRSYSERAKKAANSRWKGKGKDKTGQDIERKGKERRQAIDKQCLADACSIYDIYPKKASKPKALEAINKALKSFPADFLLERTKAYAEARKHEDPQFTPMPATWFNQQRFNDEPSTWANGKHEGAPNGHAHPFASLTRQAAEAQWRAAHPGASYQGFLDEWEKFEDGR